MRFLVLGAGKMGMVLAKDLIDSDPQNEVTLADISFDHLKKASGWIRNERLVPIQRDLEDEKQRDEVFKGQDVALCALLHKHSLNALETSVRRGVHFVDLIGEYSLERLGFDEEAKKANLVVLSGIGVSPGITNICVGRGVHLLDETDKALIYVGGNPVEPKPPLMYRIVYAVDSLLGFYERKVPVLQKGKIRELIPLTGVEAVHFPAPFQEMECFYTDGLNSLFYTMQGKVKNELWEKTIRHKGHAEGIKNLKDCGLFSHDPIKVKGKDIVPRNVLEELLDSRMKLGADRDATLMRIVVSGKKSGQPMTYVFEMIDQYDTQKRYTSMAKTTCFPASIAAQMIASGKIKNYGSTFPEDVFHGELFELFLNELNSRGVTVACREE
jgi:lysine 6-dehydrogenase